MRQVLWSERAFARRQAIEDYILYSFGYLYYDCGLVGYTPFNSSIEAESIDILSKRRYYNNPFFY